MNKHKFWAAVLVMTAVSFSVHAQSGGARDRLKAEKCYDTKGNPVSCDEQAKADAAAAAVPVVKYPNATRVEPVMPKTKIKKEWEAMVKASNGKDPAVLTAAADAVLEGKAAAPITASSANDDFVELDEEGNPVGKDDKKGARRAPAKKAAPRREKRDA